ncbi:membrane protein implicated in regulation of membrane protease activity [Catenuloplanes nepalensis]|uniref:Cytochrome c oxidase polypeptide 4 n=1 Tax=Catenuloplanes nepalensis TaxID=587533 RepID=A0ABT9MKB3_9ACTN|nr:cytochrome c oxidase subunit 4 [Catenuloplanes nepalensis]MDP9791850.1 membrane protein implicated in regulation of membrane protease activity [Catenuloplanes nepalensis]
MKAEYRMFGGVAIFLFAAAALYGFWTQGDSDVGQLEWVGTVALILSGLLCSMCAGFFWFVSRRIDPRPEDRADAEIAEGAGEVGFFSPGSYWPFGLALSCALTALGLVFFMWWLIGIGLIAVIFSACGLLFEYYSGTRRPVEF